MPSFQATFVHVHEASHRALADRLRRLAKRHRCLRQLWNVGWNEDYPWVGLSVVYAEELPVLARVTSGELGLESVALELHTASESFVYHHFVAGEHRRSLVYGLGREGVWEQVAGPPEPWEPVRRTEPAIGSTEPAIAAARWAQLAREFHRLPGSFTVQFRFGPPWPLRAASVFW